MHVSKHSYQVCDSGRDCEVVADAAEQLLTVLVGQYSIAGKNGVFA
jgi:hypothetical protein